MASPENRQPEESRVIAFPLKVTREENAALVTVAQVEGVSAQDLLRKWSLDTIVQAYLEMVERVKQ